MDVCPECSSYSEFCPVCFGDLYPCDETKRAWASRAKEKIKTKIIVGPNVNPQQKAALVRALRLTSRFVEKELPKVYLCRPMDACTLKAAETAGLQPLMILAQPTVARLASHALDLVLGAYGYDQVRLGVFLSPTEIQFLCKTK